MTRSIQSTPAFSHDLSPGRVRSTSDSNEAEGSSFHAALREAHSSSAEPEATSSSRNAGKARTNAVNSKNTGSGSAQGSSQSQAAPSAEASDSTSSSAGTRKGRARLTTGDTEDDNGSDAQTGETAPAFQSSLRQATSSSTDSGSDSSSDSDGNKDKDDSKKTSSSDGATVPVAVPQTPREVLPLIAAMPQLQNVLASATTVFTGASAGQAAPTTTTEPDADESDSAPPPQVTAPPKVDASDTTQPASTGSLAFAAKLAPQGGEVQTDASSTAPEANETRVRTVPQSTSATTSTAADPTADKSDATPDSPADRWAKMEAPAIAPSATSQPQPAATSSAKTVAAPEATPASHLEPLMQPPAAPSGSAHDITVRIPDATNGGTDVRFVDRGGEVHVSVRTSDAETAQTLRGGLSDFVGRMEHAGIKAEVWRPGADASASQNQAQEQSQNQSSHQNTDPRGGRNQSGSRGSNQPEDQQQQGQNKPRWVEELEASIGGSQNTSQAA